MSLTASRRYLLADESSAGPPRGRPASPPPWPSSRPTPPSCWSRAERRRPSCARPSRDAAARCSPTTRRACAICRSGWSRTLPSEASGSSSRGAPVVERMGESTVRLSNELDRLAVGGPRRRGDPQRPGVDGRRHLGDRRVGAVRRPDRARAGRGRARRGAADRSGGERHRDRVFAGGRLRRAHRALVELEAGRQKEVIADLDMHPYAAKMLLRRLRGTSIEELRESIAAVADLEIWCRGGSDYDEQVALRSRSRARTAVPARRRRRAELTPAAWSSD